MDIETIKLVSELGAIGIAILLIILIDRRDKRSQKAQERKDDQLTNIVTNHINSNTKSSNELSESNYKLTMAVERLISLIDKVNGKK